MLRLERVVGQRLPAAYQALLREPPNELAAFRSRLAPDELPLYDDARVVLRENQMVREEDIWTAEGPWPDDHLLIGAEISGDKFSLWLGVSPAPVCRLFHSSGRLDPICTLGELVAAIRRVARGDAPTITDALDGISAPAVASTAPAARTMPPAIARLEARVAKATRKKDRMEAMYELWAAHERAGMFAEALDVADRLIEAYPNERASWNYRIVILGRMVDAELEPFGPKEYEGAYDALFDSKNALIDAYVEAIDGQLDHARLRTDQKAGARQLRDRAERLRQRIG